MPYKLRKAPQSNLYWVVNKETGEKYSKEPIPEDRAKAQMRALYAAMQREGGATHRENVLDHLKLEGSQSLEELARASGVSIDVLQKVYNRGIGAYKTNPSSVRMKGSFKKGVNAPMSKKLSKEQWAMARVYSFLDKNPKHDQDLRETGGGRFRRELHAAVRAQTEAHIARHGRRMTPAESERVEGLVAQAEAALKLLPKGKTQKYGQPYNTDEYFAARTAELQHQLAYDEANPGMFNPDAIRAELAYIAEKQGARRVKTAAVALAAERVAQALTGNRERRPGSGRSVPVPLIDPATGEPPTDFVLFNDITHGQVLYDIRGMVERRQYFPQSIAHGIMSREPAARRYILKHPLTREDIYPEEYLQSAVLARLGDAHLPGDLPIPTTDQFRPVLQRFANRILRREPISFPREAFNIARPPPVQAEAFSV